jgi:hypothetical protein
MTVDRSNQLFFDASCLIAGAGSKHGLARGKPISACSAGFFDLDAVAT